jgi:hypothetical protein
LRNEKQNLAVRARVEVRARHLARRVNKWLSGNFARDPRDVAQNQISGQLVNCQIIAFGDAQTKGWSSWGLLEELEGLKKLVPSKTLFFVQMKGKRNSGGNIIFKLGLFGLSIWHSCYFAVGAFLNKV